MSPFQKPSIGIALGAGLAFATVWCYQNLPSKEPAIPQNELPMVSSMRGLKSVSGRSTILLTSAQDGDESTGDTFSLDLNANGISLNSPELKPAPVESNVVLEAIPPTKRESSDFGNEPPKTLSAEAVEDDKAEAAMEWPSEVVELEKPSESKAAKTPESDKQSFPVVNSLRKAWKPPVTGQRAVSAQVSMSQGFKNPHFETAKNQAAPKDRSDQSQSLKVGTDVKTTEQNSAKSTNDAAFEPIEKTKELTEQVVNLKSDAENSESSGASSKSPLPPVDDVSVMKLESLKQDSKQDSISEQKHDPYQRALASPIVFAQSSASDHTPPAVQVSDAVTVRAVQHIEYGKTLARRGARASAKQEFMAALSMIAQDFDAQTQSDRHSQALRRGTVALREAEEFVSSDSESQIGMDVSTLVETHQCGALKKNESVGLSPMQALQRYFGFAQMQIEHGVGNNVVSAEALYCLGRLHTLVDSTGIAEGKLDRARAMVYHRASLNCDATNYRSANELGVLLAEFGELNESIDLFKESLIIRPMPATWENLAKVHGRLNQTELAQLAIVEHQRAQNNQSSGMIRWLEQDQFNATAPPEVIIASNPTENSETSQRKDLEGKRHGEAKTEQNSLPDRVKSWF